jgi:predicted negative regulator of RcsB-dependent stress response
VSDYLTDEEQLARLRSWWERNGTALIVGLVLAVGAVVGWRWYQGNLDERTVRASDLYAEFQEAEGEARAELADRIVAEGEGTAYPTLVLLEQAEAEVTAEGGTADPEPLLRRAVDLASGEELADLARLRLARVLFDADRADDALAALGQIRGEGYLSLAAELKGDIHLARDERALAHESYTTALSHVQSGDQRPVLEMKIADTADTSDS